MKFSDSFWGIRCVWLRYFDVFRKSLPYYAVTTFGEPILYLLSFGLGVGSLVGKLHANGVSLTYRQFIFAGIIGQTVLFQGFFEASYGAFVRMYYQRIFQAMATTPVTLSEVLWGELLWDSSKATLAAEIVILIGVVTHDFPVVSLLTAFPLCFFSSFLFSAIGLATAASSKTIDSISYPQYILVFPMFLFCGVFYPIDVLPKALRVVAWCLPLTSVNSLARTLTLGLPFQWWALPVLAIWTIGVGALSRKLMMRRLVK